MLYTNTCEPDKYTIKRDGACNNNHIIDEIIRNEQHCGDDREGLESTPKFYSALVPRTRCHPRCGAEPFLARSGVLKSRSRNRRLRLSSLAVLIKTNSVIGIAKLY